jgi:hypothetical protein
MNVKKAPEIISRVAEIVAKWNEFAEQTKVEPVLRDAIGKTLLII